MSSRRWKGRHTVYRREKGIRGRAVLEMCGQSEGAIGDAYETSFDAPSQRVLAPLYLAAIRGLSLASLLRPSDCRARSLRHLSAITNLRPACRRADISHARHPGQGQVPKSPRAVSPE